MTFSRSFVTGIKSSLFFLFLVSGYSSYAQFSLLKDINPIVDDNGSFDLFYQQVELNGIVYFIGNDEVSGAELWRTDGTLGGTYQVKDINTSSYMSTQINYITKMGNAIYFAATDGTGVELWKSDGTNAGTKMVKRINTIPNSYSSPMYLVAIGNTLYFSANDYKMLTGYTNRELWKSDGTAAGTVKVKEINPSTTGGSDPTDLINVNGKLFFTADDGTNGPELWTSDGTSAGTMSITNLSSGAYLYNPVVAKDKLYWIMQDNTYNQEVWVSDGTITGTYPIDLSPGNQSSIIEEIAAINDSVVISIRPFGISPNYGKELWISDGTITGSHMIKDIVPGIQSSNPQELHVIGNNVFFLVEIGEYYELWRSDLTDAGTIKLKQCSALGSAAGPPSDFTTFEGKLIFNSSRQISGDYLTGTLWQSDGTPEGTVSMDLPLYGPESMFILNNNFLFLASTQINPPHSLSIWISDGTMVNTHIVRDNQIGAQGIDFKSPLKIRQSIYYSLNSGMGLWITDGTSTGTVKATNYANNSQGIMNYKGTVLFEDGQFLKNDGTLQSIQVPSGGYINGPVIVVGDYIFYISTDHKVYGVNGLYGSPQLLAFEGLSDPTVLEMKAQDGILFINESSGGYRYTPGDASAVLISESIKEVTSFNDNVYYVDFFNRLCKINGATQQQLTYSNDQMNQLTPCNNLLYFFAQENGNALSSALWTYDGTNVTKVKAEIFPTKMIASNGVLFFTIKTDANGYELWKSNGTDAGTVMVKEINPGATSAYPDNFFNWNDILYFSASDPQYGNELWRTDGTSTGTYLVADINPGASSSYPKSIRAIDNALIVLATHPDYGQELWRVELSAPAIPQNFMATGSSNAIALYWSSDDVNVTRFDILRSTSNNGEYAKIGEVVFGTYTYNDQNVQTGITYYYTIKAIYAAGGNSPLSTTASAKVGTPTAVMGSSSNDAVTVFPNPAIDILYVNLLSETNQLEVIDLVGNSCLRFDKNIQANELFQLNISSLKSGFYFLRVAEENHQSTLKFMKK